MSLRRFSRLLPIRNPCELRGLYRRSCVFITAGPITKLFAGGGGGEWRTYTRIARIGQGDQPGGAAETHVSWTPVGEKTTSANTSGPYWG
jgi:hypothetical protein